MHDGFYSFLHVETPSSKYNLQNPNNGQIVPTIPETQDLITKIVNDFSFIEIASPEDELQVYSVSEHIASYIQ